MKKYLNKKDRSGFTLVEVMVATMIMTIVVLGGSAFCSNAGKRLQWVQDQQLLRDTAEQYLEFLKGARLGGSAFKDNDGYLLYNPSETSSPWKIVGDKSSWEKSVLNSQNRIISLWMEYKRNNETASAKASDYLDITITAQFKDGGRSVTLESYKELL